MKRLTIFFAVLCVCSMAISQQPSWGHWTRWGQQPDGIYVNPVIPSDYSDLDCIRVGDGMATYYYSLDGEHFISFGEPYQMMWGYYRGDRIGIYSFNDEADLGWVDVDYLHYR